MERTCNFIEMQPICPMCGSNMELVKQVYFITEQIMLSWVCPSHPKEIPHSLMVAKSTCEQALTKLKIAL